MFDSKPTSSNFFAWISSLMSHFCLMFCTYLNYSLAQNCPLLRRLLPDFFFFYLISFSQFPFYQKSIKYYLVSLLNSADNTLLTNSILTMTCYCCCSYMYVCTYVCSLNSSNVLQYVIMFRTRAH